MSKKVQLTSTSRSTSNIVEDKPWNTKAIDGKTTRGEVDINSIFNNIVKILLASYKAKYKQTPEQVATEQPDSVNPHIYIGLKKNDDLLFGGVIVNLPQGDGFVIDNTPYNRNFINKSKLYIMSIISNYKTDGSTLHKLINAEISKGANFDLQKVVGILGMPPIIPVKAPPPPVIEAPVISSDDMFELDIYREFAVKCSNSGECANYDAEYKIMLDTIPERKLIMPQFKLINQEKSLVKRPNGTIRNLYVFIAEYITGTEGAGSDPITAILEAVKEIIESSTKKEFFGFKTSKIFDINRLILKLIEIRELVRKRQKLPFNKETTLTMCVKKIDEYKTFNSQTPR